VCSIIIAKRYKILTFLIEYFIFETGGRVKNLRGIAPKKLKKEVKR
jgi:hypothetical protein